MADQKISELTALTGANAADDDVLAIVDTSAVETKKITRSELFTDTPTITTDGLTVDKASGSLIDLNATASGTPTNYITYSDTGGATAYVGFDSGANDNFTVYNATATGDITLRTNSLQRLNIDGATGDISFYEDTGTTAKFFWDASAERLGIGDSTPSQKLDVNGNIRVTGGFVEFSGDTSTPSAAAAIHRPADNTLAFSTLNTERMRIGSSGSITMPNVYNDTTASPANLHISSAGGQLFRSTSSARYKNTIANASFGIVELMALRPVTYKGNNDGDTVFGGLIAEEVHDAGLVEFVQYNEEGEPDALAYGNMVSLCIKAIQEQQATITTLTDRITALENS